MCTQQNIHTPKHGDLSWGSNCEREGQFIARVAEQASINARNDTLNRGRPVMTLEDDCIVRRFPDGTIETVRKIGVMSHIPEEIIYRV